MSPREAQGCTKLFVVLTVTCMLLGCARTEPPKTEPALGPSITPTSPAPTVTQPRLEQSATLAPGAESEDYEASSAGVPELVAEPVTLANPSFEAWDGNGMPTGWTNAGAVEAVKRDERGHDSDFRLTHQGAEPYRVETSQTITGLASQWYTLRAWVRSSGGQNAVAVGLTCGSEERKVQVPSTSPGYRWLQLVVSNQVTDGECTVRLASDGRPDTWSSFDDIELVPGRAALSVLGADISSLKKSEDLGGIYRDSDGTPGDALRILKDRGLNYARLRVWVDPADGYHNKARLLAMAQRLKSLGIRLLVDFHYSDNWADPGKQIKPAAWKDYDFEQLKQAVYDHTYHVCSSLAAQGTPPEMVQVGNEINSGLLWPDADYNHFDNMADLLKEGHRAVKECSPSTQVMLHIAEGGDNDMARWWFGNIKRRDVPFDVIGISYYPYWHGSLAQLQYNLNDITARYDRDVIVVETSYAFTDRDHDDYPNIVDRKLAVPGYALTPEGQRSMLRDVMAVVRAVNGGRGLGVFYWDATWTAVEGNGWDNTNPAAGNAWENQALFDFDGQVLPAIDEYVNP